MSTPMELSIQISLSIEKPAFMNEASASRGRWNLIGIVEIYRRTYLQFHRIFSTRHIVGSNGRTISDSHRDYICWREIFVRTIVSLFLTPLLLISFLQWGLLEKIRKNIWGYNSGDLSFVHNGKSILSVYKTRATLSLVCLSWWFPQPTLFVRFSSLGNVNGTDWPRLYSGQVSIPEWVPMETIGVAGG